MAPASGAMHGKTHTTAVVLMPPEEVWEPIQRIRRLHDRQVRRWMPHVNLLYPFRPRGELASAAPLVAKACARVEPFRVELSGFRFFDHGRSFTLWLDPEPREPLVRLQAELAGEFADCDDQGLFESGFRPHLSVGQAHARAELDALLAELAGSWRPLEFVAREVAVIRRGPDTGDVFRVEMTAPLGRPGGRAVTSSWREPP